MTACQFCHHEPTYQHAQAQQQPFRGMWQALCAWEQERHRAGHPIYPNELRAKVHEIADASPDAAATFAVNTTRFDRPLDEVTEGMV